MNEVRALVEAFDAVIAAGERCALATIVSVEGSSYRRPGARMLICESGKTTGTISAGCLEDDVIEHAKRAIHYGEGKLVEYDNASTNDEMAWGLGLGCNGIVRVLIEPLAADSLYIEALRNSYQLPPDSASVSSVTVYQHIPSVEAFAMEPGARLFIRGRDDIRSEKLNGSATALYEAVRPSIDRVTSSDDLSLEVDGEVKVFIETLLSPVPLVIFGAGHDAVPIVGLARGLGWQTDVVDPQARAVSHERFAVADHVILARPEDVEWHVTITRRTMALIMSHNYLHDVKMLKFLLESPARYIGVMGPRKRTERMLEELAAAGHEHLVDEANRARLHSPVGLDIGANGPEEIALSIVAEMRAVLNGREGGMLRNSRGPIRGTAPTERESNESKRQSVAAVILAAGSSSRMGRPKQTLQFEGESLLRRAANAAIDAGCSPVIVVTGANAELSRGELAGLDVREVFNPHWETGMASSIVAGLEGLLSVDPDAAATVIKLCDQPYVNSETISRLMAAHRLTRNSIIASKYGDGFGAPALFKRSLFDQLLQLEGHAGAKQVIKENLSEAHFINFPDGDIDLDTPDDLSRLIGGNRKVRRSNLPAALGFRRVAASSATSTTK